MDANDSLFSALASVKAAARWFAACGGMLALLLVGVAHAQTAVVVSVTNPTANPQVGLNVYAFNNATYSNVSAVTDASGNASLVLPAGDYRFRVDKNGTQFFTGAANHCSVPSCTTVSLQIPDDVVVQVASSAGGPEAGLNVYAFDGSTYVNKSAVTDASGNATFTLLNGNYRFRIDKNGTQFFTSAGNNCAVPGCTSVSYEVPANITVSVTSGGAPASGLNVYAFDGTTYVNKSGVTNANGQAVFTLLPGNYRFRIDRNGTQYFTGTGNHCSAPGCTSVSIDLPASTIVTVTSSSGGPEAGLNVYAFDGTTYVNKSAVTDASGNATFTLLNGNYRFRIDKNGTQFFTSAGNNCAVPGCTSVSYVVPANITVSVTSGGVPASGLNVYAFDGTTYVNKSGVTNANGQAVFTLLPGNYRFRVDKNGTEFFTGPANHCTAPGCTTASLDIPPNVTVTVTSTAGAEPGLNVYAFDGNVYMNKSAVTDATGKAVFTLLPGNYRFRTDKNGQQYFSSPADNCTVPGCTAVSQTVPSPIPGITITAPADGAVIPALSLPVVLTAQAIDQEDGDISNRVVFTSDRDGVITSPAMLSVGTHVITARITDNDGNTNSKTVTVTVQAATLFLSANLDPTLNSNQTNVSVAGNGLQAQKTSFDNAVYAVFGNIARTTGKYAFQYKPTAVDASALGNSGAGIVPADATVQGLIGINIPGSYGYHGNGTKNAPGNPGGSFPELPLTYQGQAVLIEVDLDARKIWLRSDDRGDKILLYDNITVAGSGMRPALDLKQNTVSVVNFTGPFDLPLDAGYMPWAANYPANAVPVLTINAPTNKTEFMDNESIAFDVTAVDPQEGDLTSKIIYKSSRDGIINKTTTLSAGYHVISATATDGNGITGSVVFPEFEVQAVHAKLDLSLNGVTGVTLTNDGLTATAANTTDRAAFANRSHKHGRYAFQYKPKVLNGPRSDLPRANYAGIGLVPAHSIAFNTNVGNATSGSYAYYGYSLPSGPSGSAADAQLPYTDVNDALVFMVDLDKKTIRVRGAHDTVSRLLFSNITVSTDGMRPAATVLYGSSMDVNFSGPFDLPVDAGYLPWDSQIDPASIPAVTITSPANNTRLLQSNLPGLAFTATAVDAEDGNLAANVHYNSSINGNFSNPADLSPGIHVINAIVTDSAGNVGSDRIMLTVDSNTTVGVDLTTANLNNAITLTGTDGLTAQYKNYVGLTWNTFYLNKARSTGKFAFAYTKLLGPSGYTRAGITSAPVNDPTVYPGSTAGSWAYIDNANKATVNTNTDITSPTTDPGETLLFMVDLDAGTIRVRGTGDTASKVIFSGLSFSEFGMRPSFALASGAKIQVNVTGSFGIPLDPGYIPWQSTIDTPPVLTLLVPGTEFVVGSPISISATATDQELGDLSGSITWTSSISGNLGTGATINPTLPIGNHVITATVFDGNNTVSDSRTISVIAVPNQPPFVSITSPDDGVQVSEGASVTFTGTAQDPEQGNLSSGIQWKSDKDGNLGTGATLTVSTLSHGLHVITATRADANGATGDARITVMVGTPTPKALYSHNALGQRVVKTNSTTNATTHFIYDQQGRTVAEIDAATGNTLREYVYVNGQQVAVVDNTGTQNEQVYFVHNDHLGTPQKITDSNENVVWAADYEPFGKVSITTNAISSNTRFPGQYADGETGLNYNYFRDYDPETGRYVESDPIGLSAGNNTYGYVKNRPIIAVDPSGQFAAVAAPVVVGVAAILAGGYCYATHCGQRAIDFLQKEFCSLRDAFNGLFNESSDGDGNKPPPNSKPIDETDWSGDHQDIKKGVGAGPRDKVVISPNGDVWAQNPNGSWTNHGEAGTFTGSGGSSGRKGKDRDRRW